ncbi:hypothetical protein [Peribacillus kribbensis]|uniref:hypothetical protein n=1 Tax=Peribacillus kribbensis TaxID=356658 RepID=UPI00047DBB50|nr:hypothetical protein [Peribacillus kribbensis]
MKRAIGLLIISQTFLFGIIAYYLNTISVSIFTLASVSKKLGTGVSFGWNDNLTTKVYILLAIVSIIGLYLVFSKQDHKQS